MASSAWSKLVGLFSIHKKVERSVRKHLDEIKLQNGKILSQLQLGRDAELAQNIHLAEFKVFSQCADDGIIQFLVRYLDIKEQTFIEFGVEDYREANTRFLLINNNWKGLIMDGSTKNMQSVRESSIYWMYDLTALDVFVTKENINDLIRNNGFGGEIGLLHIDIDGNDYWIWKEIDCISPVIVIMEFNTVWGPDKPWTIPYDPAFFRGSYHHSNLYYGASIASLCDLAEEKGYYFIGSNSSGNNAYFVRKDRIKGLRPVSAREGFVLSKFRESRDKDGKLTFVTGEARIELLKGMQVYNTRTHTIEEI